MISSAARRNVERRFLDPGFDTFSLIGLLTAAETAWAHALGVVSLLGFVALGFPAALPPTVNPHTDETKR
jgi:hypothetical protein